MRDEIKAEYIRGGISFRALAEKYGVSEQAISERGRRGKWAEAKKKAERLATEKLVKKAAERKAREFERLETIRSRLLEKLESAIDGLDTSATRKTVFVKEDGRRVDFDYSLLDCVNTLAQLMKLYGYTPEVEEREDDGFIVALSMAVDPATKGDTPEL